MAERKEEDIEVQGMPKRCARTPWEESHAVGSKAGMATVPDAGDDEASDLKTMMQELNGLMEEVKELSGALESLEEALKKLEESEDDRR